MCRRTEEEVEATVSGLKKNLKLRSGSQRHRHFVGFLNVPVQAPTWGHPFYTVFSSPVPKARVSYCHSKPSVRPSVVRRRPSSSVNFSHFRLLHQNRWMDFNEIW